MSPEQRSIYDELTRRRWFQSGPFRALFLLLVVAGGGLAIWGTAANAGLPASRIGIMLFWYVVPVWVLGQWYWLESMRRRAAMQLLDAVVAGASSSDPDTSTTD